MACVLFQMNTDRSVSAFPEGESLFKWIGTISGPIGTVRSLFSFHSCKSWW